MCLKHRLICLALSLILWLPSASTAAEELDLINRPVSLSGLTGLLYTVSPYTIPGRTVELSASVQSENSVKPDFTLSEYPLTITVAVGSSQELAVRTSYFYRNDASVVKSRAMGDAEVSYKIMLFKPDADQAAPDVAVFGTVLAPTAGEDNGLSFGRVTHWGARAGVAVGSELFWRDHVMALYGDAQIAVRDLSDELIRDRFYIVDAGVLVPISKHRNLQLFVEYRSVSGKDVQDVDGLDRSMVTYGLRLVRERFNLTFGSQFIHKTEDTFDDSSRVIGNLSMKF